MQFGVLNRGFTIHTPTMQVKVQKGTAVRFHSSSPTIEFSDIAVGNPIKLNDIPIRLFRAGREWFADIYGEISMVLLPKGGNLPYPMSYFKA